MPHKMPHHKRKMLHSPSPPPLLFVYIFNTVPKMFSLGRIHGNRQIYRHNAIIPAITQKTLQKNARVLCHDIFLPKTHIGQRSKRHAVRRKSKKPVRPLQFSHNPKSRAKSSHAQQRITLPNVIVVKCHRLVRSVHWFWFSAIKIG